MSRRSIAVLVVVAFAASCSRAATRATTATRVSQPTTTVAARTSTTVRPTFSVHETTVDIGGRVAFSGAGCRGGDTAEATISGSEGEIATDLIVTSKASGSWSGVTTVGDGTGIGSQQATARCVDPVVGVLFDYPPVPVQVHTFRGVRLVPTATVRPGDTVAVEESGHCPVLPDYERDGPRVVVEGLDPAMVQTTVTDGAAGSWHATLHFSQNAVPGMYQVDATCYGHRFVSAFYPPVDLEIAGS